ncbi:BTAD domain-containing putative transcriptional regulator [Lentzea roselyniae]|uniref:BTAD domain-containing putative transcriptional regulator n=1 Tax=Lentzea roselyniae TaxID=531940 RepID=A0ABP7C661_9PSEU
MQGSARNPRLRVDMLGPVRAVFDDTEIPLGPGRQRAVFALLASRAGAAVSREELIAAVWGDSAPASAAGSVYTYVSALRRALAATGAADTKEFLVSTKNGYSLRLDPQLVDVMVFDRLVARAEGLTGQGDHRQAAELLAQALALFRGEPYSGVPGPYAEHERFRWAERRLVAVEALATARLVLGAHAELAAELGALVRNHPLRESLHALLMLALSRGGRQAEALEVFREARETLLYELGTAPGAVLLEAHAAVLSGMDEQCEPEPAALGTPHPADSTVFVGREVELGRLRTRLAELAAGVGGSVWIEGESGIGKSELLAVGLADAERLGCQVGWAVADQLAGRFPLQVILECLGVEVSSSDPWRAELALQLRAGEPADRSVDDNDPIQKAVDQLLALVDRMTANAPTVLVLDDFQWADESSAYLVRRLAAATRQLPLLLVTCSRSRHGRVELDQLRSRVRGNGGDVLVLEPLSSGEVDSITAHLVGGRPSPPLRRLTARAAGNPLYLREMIGALLREHAVDLIDGVAHVEEWKVVNLPCSLSAALERTSQALSEQTRKVLCWAAVLGSEATTARIVGLSGWGAAEVSRAIEDAISANLLAQEPPRVVFRHPLVREVLYEGIPVSIRQTMHRRAAQALAGARAAASRVAEQLIAAGSVQDDWVIGWLVDNAAELSNRAPQIAAELLERVVDVIGSRDPRREVLLAALVRVLFHLARAPEKQARQALAISTDPARSAELRQILAAILLKRDRRDLAIRTLTEVEPDAAVPEIWRLRHKLLLAHLKRDLTNVDEAEASAKDAHAEAIMAGDSYLVSHALQTRWLVDSVRRDHRAALRHVDEAIEAVRGKPGLAAMHTSLLDNRVFTLQNLDQLKEADEALRAADELVVAHRLPGGPQVSAAVHHYWTGQWDEALLELETTAEDGPAISYSGLVDPGSSGLLLHGVFALISLRRNDSATAAAHLDAADQQLISTAAERESCDFLLVARSLAAAQRGDAKQALDAVAHILEPAYSELMLRHQWLPEIVRLAIEVRDEERLAAALEIAELEAARETVPARARTALQRCRALATGDPDLAMLAVEHYREVGRRVELAAALEEAAVLFAKAGRRDEAEAAYVEAADIFTALNARWDLAVAAERLGEFGIDHDQESVGVRVEGGFDTLTPVERRIAGLVASGWSNPDIALQMSLPRRLVQAHVTRVLDKLGVRSRTQIAWLYRHERIDRNKAASRAHRETEGGNPQERRSYEDVRLTSNG